MQGLAARSARRQLHQGHRVVTGRQVFAGQGCGHIPTTDPDPGVRWRWHAEPSACWRSRAGRNRQSRGDSPRARVSGLDHQESAPAAVDLAAGASRQTGPHCPADHRSAGYLGQGKTHQSHGRWRRELATRRRLAGLQEERSRRDSAQRIGHSSRAPVRSGWSGSRSWPVRDLQRRILQLRSPRWRQAIELRWSGGSQARHYPPGGQRLRTH